MSKVDRRVSWSKTTAQFQIEAVLGAFIFFKKKSFSFTPLLHGGVHNAQNTTLAQPRTDVCLALSKKQIRAVHWSPYDENELSVVHCYGQVEVE